jgi:hypothetical protein
VAACPDAVEEAAESDPVDVRILVRRQDEIVPGVDVMITVFAQFRGKYVFAFFFKTIVMIQFLPKNAVF